MSNVVEDKKESSSQIAQKAETNGFFETAHLKADLKRSSVQSGAITMLNNIVTFLLRTGSTIVLARLLTPRDYGLIAMVSAVTNFVTMFNDMGLSFATIQKADVNHAQISTLFWLNVLMGFGLFVLTAALSPVVAWFYGEPRLTWITLALSFNFLCTGLTVQHLALLRRQMRFGAVAIVEILSLAVGIAVGIVAAFYGCRYWALVLMQLAMSITGTVVLWGVCRWRPGLPVHKSGISSMVHFGLNVTGFGIVNYFSRNLDSVLIGRFCGSAVLGLYSNAYKLLLWPLDYIRGPLTLVAMPALSHLQNDPVRYRRYYYKLLSLLALMSTPLIIFLAVCSDNVIRLLLGEQWAGAAILFKIMAFAGFIQVIMGTSGLVLLSSGQSGRYFKAGFFNSLFMVASFIIGLQWGALGVATSYAIVNYLTLFPLLWYCFRFTPVSTLLFLKAVWSPVTASLLMGAVVFLCRSFLINQPDIIVLGVCLVIAVLSYLLALVLIPTGRRTLYDAFSYVPLLLRKRTAW